MNRTPLPPAIKFVLATMLVNSIGFGIIIPSFPQLIMSLGHVSLSRAIAIGGWLSLTYALFQFIFGPVMGNLSDRFGRRPVRAKPCLAVRDADADRNLRRDQRAVAVSHCRYHWP